MSNEPSLRKSESLSKIPRSSSRPKLNPRDSILTKTNSLNPVLRINRSASASIGTSNEHFHAQRSRTNSASTGSSARSPTVSKKSQNHQDERSRRTSSESLRNCLERAPSPSPSAASSSTSKKSSPSSFMRRSSSSHSSLNSLHTPSRGIHIRNTSTASAPAVQNTVSFPSNYSPTHPTTSSTTTAPSFDILKSSLRDTLANYSPPNGDESASSMNPRKRSERRSVSFLLDEAQAISEAAKAESSLSNTATSTATSSPSTTISSRTSTSSSIVRTYPVTDWQPLSQDDDHDGTRTPILPLQLARYIIALSEKDSSLPEASETASERDSTDNGTASPVEAGIVQSRDEVVYRDTGTIVKVAETFIGLWLAIIWLTIGRIVGSDRSR